MSDLTNWEKRQFEKLFGMSSGYVLDFSNRSFDDFVVDSTGLSILEEKYNKDTGSKANRLRALWSLEPNPVVAKLLRDLMQCVRLDPNDAEQQKLNEECGRAVARISGGVNPQDIVDLTPNSPEREFAILAREVRESIEKNEPEVGLDRLHTFAVKYFRVLCEQRGISTDREKPLHSLVGEYTKTLKASGHLQSEMSERILKSSISTFDAFNAVRNDQSLAHDNRILSYDEALLIYTHVASAIKFVEAMERRIAATPKPQPANPFAVPWSQYHGTS